MNFIGLDAHGTRAGETCVFEDDELPLLVFGHLSLLRPGKTLMIEKLLTDRSGEKGDRDLLVALALLLVSEAHDLTEIEVQYQGLPPELRWAARSGLSTLSLLEPRLSMQDPTLHRMRVAKLLARLEKKESNR